MAWCGEHFQSKVQKTRKWDEMGSLSFKRYSWQVLCFAGNQDAGTAQSILGLLKGDCV